MKAILAAAILLTTAGTCRAFDLQSMDAQTLAAQWFGVELPEPEAMPVETPGSYSCEGEPLTMRLRGRTVTLAASGTWTLESHLATTEDSFPGRRSFPKSVRENIHGHLARSCELLLRAVPDADCGEVYGTRWDKEWTPPENGKAGQGSIGDVKPSPEEEMWIFNMMWVGKSMPKAGTKFLASFNGRNVAVVGGYERGLSSRKFLGGFQREVFRALGAEYGKDKITISALKGQAIPPGPVNCAGI